MDRSKLSYNFKILFFIKIIVIMRKNFTLLSVFIISVIAMSCGPRLEPAIPGDAEMESYIRSVLKRMTLEEKVGQMTQLTITTITDASGVHIDEAKLDSVIGKYKVGSILNVPGEVSQTPEVYHRLISRIQEKSMEVMGIPCIYGLDQIHGATYTVGATFFPQEINLAATFNREYPRIMGEVTAYETRACLVPWTFAPVMDLGRDPRWPRMWESYGEDVYMNSTMAVESVKGLQGPDPNQVDEFRIASCIKHYMGYGVPVSGKDRTPSSIASRDLREKYFEPFKECIESGALSLMVNSASNNGIPFHANYELLTEWVKNDLNWDGLIVTDWADINNLYTREHVAASEKEAVKMAINAGIDMSMVPYDWNFCNHLVELVREGEVPMSRIDDAVLRVLRLKYRLGLFEKPVWNTDQYQDFASEEFASKALAAAIESEVLLKNEGGLLPLSRDTKILVCGPNSHTMRSLNGGWSYSWQGHRTDEFAANYHTIYEALSGKFGSANVSYVPGVEYDRNNWWEDHDTGISTAVAAARRADVVIVCVGENSYCETPGNLNDLNLSMNQKQLVKALSATGKPLVLILNEGRPRIISDIEPLAAAVVDIMLPGNYGGDALAELLSGEANFSGRLPFTYPKHINSLATYDYKTSENVATMSGMYNYDAVMDIQWPFGYGLSYTEFEYSNFRLDKPEFSHTDHLVFTVDVKNIGSRAGKEAVQLYSSDLVASSLPDVIRLRNFEKISLAPGESTTVSMTIKASDLAFVGQDDKWRLEAGEFRFRCGDQILHGRCTDTYVWETPNR